MTEPYPKGLTRLRRPPSRVAEKEAPSWGAERKSEFEGKILVLSLGLRLPNRDAAIRCLKLGLPVSTFRELRTELDMTEAQLASVARVALRTIARRKKAGRLEFGESERIFRLGVLFDTAVRVLGGVEAARRWLKAPQKGLDGRSPLEYSDTAIGAREVEDLLGRLEHGVFA